MKFKILLSFCIAAATSVSTFAQTSPAKVIHVLVALCDNKYQGIVPVPAKIGNGQDPDNNLYWGCAFGIRTFFKKSNEWKLLSTRKQNGKILERLVFKHTNENYYLVADAWDGQNIKDCTTGYLNSCSGRLKDTVNVNGITIGTGGSAALLAYIGHDGLMDFELNQSFKNTDGVKRDCIILACYSKNYFSSSIRETGATPLLWTTGLMCPEAYTLHDALSGYIEGNTHEEIRTLAAKAYSRYQKCPERSARNLLVSGH